MLGRDRQFRFLKFPMAGEPYKYAVFPHTHPKISDPIILDHEHRQTREPGVSPEDLGAPSIHPAEFCSAAVPEDIILYQNPEGRRTGRSLGLRIRVRRKSIPPVVGKEFNKAGVGAQKCVPFAIRLNAFGPVNCFERN